MSVIGLDAGQRDRTECEHLLARAVRLCGGATLACTHVVSSHWAASIQLVGAVSDPEWLGATLGAAVWTSGAGAGSRQWFDGAKEAEQQMRTRSGGRAVLFPGVEQLVGVVAADDVSVLSAITRVRGIADTPTAGMRLHTRDHVRPELIGGELVLTVRPWGSDGDLAPFEVPNPTPCCPTHS